MSSRSCKARRWRLKDISRKLEICIRLGDPARLAGAYTLLGHLASTEHDFVRALELYQLALSLEELATAKTVVWQSRASVLNNVGFALVHLGRLEQAEARLEEAVQSAHDEGTTFVENAALNNLARVALALRDAGSLRHRLRDSLLLLDAAPDLHILVEAFDLLARLCCLSNVQDSPRAPPERPSGCVRSSASVPTSKKFPTPSGLWQHARPSAPRTGTPNSLAAGPPPKTILFDSHSSAWTDTERGACSIPRCPAQDTETMEPAPLQLAVDLRE